MLRRLLLCLTVLVASNTAYSDIVKPALVEISANANGSYQIEIRASIEAILTGINSQYKNTTESPNADAYDVLRELEPSQLQDKFTSFEKDFSQSIKLIADNNELDLAISNVSIPEPGYTKVPRISVITLSGELPVNTQSLRWYYPEKFSDQAVRVRQVNEQKEQWHWSNWQWIRDDSISEPFSLTEVFHQPTWSSIVWTYLDAGFDHIIPLGLDHILFVLGIFLLSTKLKPLLLQVTMFTLAHSITLSLAMLDIFSLSPQVVEPLIALSISWIAIENIFVKSIHKFRLMIVFAFGLLHGMGFASMLADFGMPDNGFATALVSFNVGVEIGQLAVILIAYLLVGRWFNSKPWYHQRIVVPASLLIAIIGIYWFIERLSF